MFEFEHKRQKIISRSAFSLRLTYNALIALALVMFALAVGMLGYMWLGGLTTSGCLLQRGHDPLRHGAG